jgi:phosphoserine aminotransferase
MPRVHNFSAGPGPIPLAVRHRIADTLHVPADGAPSVIEVSHRSAPFLDVAERLETGLRRLMGLDDAHQILLMSGGAQLQFAMLPLNLAANAVPAYVDSGYWSRLAIEQARPLGPLTVCASGEATQYTALPTITDVPAGAAYLHFCSNETIQGLQFAAPPRTDVPLVADLSSEFLSRPYPFRDLGVAYACAQKNLGVAGLTVVVVRRDLLARSPQSLPSMLSYAAWSQAAPMPNTPCTFAWYVAMEVVEWIEREGGLAAMAARNAEKAARLYAALDADPAFELPARVHDRSPMNVVFRLADRSREPALRAAATAAGIVGIEGHRAVGGFRVSLYNAVPLEAVDHLIGVLQEFSRQH